MKNKRKFVLTVFLLFAVVIVGTTGYMLLLKVGVIDALYMTVNTISTVGFSEVGVMTNGAKIFTVLIIFAGLFVVGYGATSMVSLFFEGNLKAAWRRKRMETKINELKDHYIICGAGEVGRTVIKSLKQSTENFVVIEESAKRVEELKEAGITTILGNATHEDVLEKAGIAHAKGIVCALSTDAENVFTVLTARQMHEDIFIISKAVEKNAHNKLIKAGADKTISPNEIGGQRMAALIMRPSVISFLDVITRAGNVTLDLEEVVIPQHSGIIGQKLLEAKIPEQTGLIVLALKEKGQTNFKFNPSSSEILNDGDTMVVLGTNEQVDQLKAMVNR